MLLPSLLFFATVCFAAGCLMALIMTLYCIAHNSTAYDNQVDDEQQIKFLQNRAI